MADRKASAAWHGNLFEGAGTVSADSSALFTAAPVSWAARTEAPGATTSPEELIAAAHAACFCMALSNELSSRGTPPETLEVGATCTFVPGEGVTAMVLDVIATMPGVSEEQFRTGLDAAEQSCPVSGALRGNVAITVHGRLA